MNPQAAEMLPVSEKQDLQQKSVEYPKSEMNRKLSRLTKRCSSLSEIENLDLDLQFGKDIARKSSKDSALKHKIHHKAYRGRFSLGRPLIHSTKAQRRKSFNRDSQYFGDDDDDGEDNGLDSPGQYNRLTLSPVTSQSAFQCIPVIERESSSTSIDSGRVSDATQADSLLHSLSIDDQEEFICARRDHFYKTMNNFVSASKSTANRLVLNQKEHKGKMEKTFTCTIGAKPKDHKHCDVLWLNLKAFFSGKDVCGCQEATFDEDKLLFKKRESHWGIIDDISKYKAIPFPNVPQSLEACYMTHMGQVRDQVHALIERLDHYQAYFPTRKAMLDYITKMTGNAALTHQFSDRVEVMTAWLNTVDDLFNKIKTLGEIFEVDHLPDAIKIWPRPMGPSQVSISLKEARPVFKEYVGKNRNLKAMKKVLVRVWDICENSIVKAALLLGKKAATYAQAASGFKPHIPMSEEQRERYNNPIRGTNSEHFGCQHAEFSKMELPSFLPIFLFILGVRQELVQEWLTFRSNFVGFDGEADSLTLGAIIEDSRDCLGEAIGVKIHYLSIMHGIGMGAHPHQNASSSEYDECLKDVFRKYLDYVFRWTKTVCKVNQCSGDTLRLFDELFREWNQASTYACSIPSGIVSLSTTYETLIQLLIDKLVIEYWEKNAETIAEQHSISDINEIDEYERDDDRSHNSRNSLLNACREHARIIRTSKDRMKRIFTLLRDTMLKDLNNAAAYNVSNYFSAAFLAGRLRGTHALIRFGDYDDHRLLGLKVAVLIELGNVDNAEKLVKALCECRRVEGLGYLLVLPFPDIIEKWEGKAIRVNIDDEAIMSFRYIRNNYIFAVGDYDDNNNHHVLSMFDRELTATSSNDNVADCLQDLTEALMEKSEALWNEVKTLSYVYEHETDNKKFKETIYSTIQQAFDLIFEVHRDVLRIVGDSHKNVFGEQLMYLSVEIVGRWHDLVKMMRPRPAPHLPVWANLVFNFIAYIADPKWTRYLDDATFNRFIDTVNDCRLLIVPVEGAAQIGKRSTRTSSFVARARKQVNSPLNRRARLKEAAQKTDQKRIERDKEVFNMGKVIENTSRNKFDLAAHMDPSRKPPFQWQKLEKIGSGSFADVYKALNCDEKCVIAVKKLHVEKKHIPVIEREIEIFSALKHENLVKYFGFQLIQDDIYILMEYCAEGTLERICREVMDMTCVRMYTNSLLKAIAYLHTQKIVHRDIKPANIFLDLRSRLKLGDFGCSVRLREQDTVRGELAEYAGTPQYMAPEVQTYGGKMEDGRFRGYGRAVDIWSLGCVVLHMVTGRLPWPDCHNSYAITMRVCTGEKPTYPPQPPAILKHFLDSCFENDPQKRATAETLLQDVFANVHVDVDTVYSSTNGLASPCTP